MPAIRGAGVLIALLVLGLAATWVAPGAHDDPAMRPLSVTAPAGYLPQVVAHAGPATVAAYRAALARPEILASVPCLCGCEASLGHRHNLDCYRAGELVADRVDFDTHGIDCTVCQVITALAIDGAERGLRGPELRQLVLDTYGVDPDGERRSSE